MIPKQVGTVLYQNLLHKTSTENYQVLIRLLLLQEMGLMKLRSQKKKTVNYKCRAGNI
jgi:hypothetical protein